MDGYREFVKKHMDYSTFFQKLEESEASLFARMKILQYCAVGKPTFLLRTHPPEATAESAAEFDSRINQCITRWLGRDASGSRIVTLPMRMGGLGLRRTVEIAPLAFAARETGEQKKATAELDERVLSEIATAQSEQQQAIMNSFASVPLPEVNDDALRVHLRERLLLHTSTQTTCGACSEAASQWHVHLCRGVNEERISRHDHIVKCLRRAAEVRYVVQEEHSVRHTRHRPDLKIYTDGVAAPMLVDVSVTFVGSVSGTGRAIAKVEQDKRAKYQAVGVTVEPFVIGNTGELGESAWRIISKIMPKEERGPWVAEIRSILLQGNLRMHRAMA